MKLPREANDFYRTPPVATRGLLGVETFAASIWEPACGDGAISVELAASGYDVFSTDLIDRGFGFSGVDFLQSTECVCPDIVTNPPYKLAGDFVTHALSLGVGKMAMLLRLAWLEGEARRKTIFAIHPPARIWVMSSRPTLWHGGDPNARETGGATSYAWFVWDTAAPVDAPRLGWIAKGEAEIRA